MRRLLLILLLLLPCCLTAGGWRILFIGDSITDGGWGRSGGSMAAAEERNQRDLNHLYGHSFMLFAAAHLESRYPERGDQFFNRGISGYTLRDLNDRWEHDVAAIQPDLLSILIGTNDVAKALERPDQPFDIAAWEAMYRALLDRTRTLLPRVELVLCTPFAAETGRLRKASDNARREADLAACCEVVRRLATDYNARLVEFDTLFEELQEQHPNVAGEHWIWDGIHPTAAGHRLMADRWIEVVGPLFEQQPNTK